MASGLLSPFAQLRRSKDWTPKSANGLSVSARNRVEERRRLLAKFLKESFTEWIPTIKIRQEVDVGSPYKRIVDKAAEEGVDIIVMSTQGRTGLLHMLIGSVTERTVRLATCPVLTIHPAKEIKPAGAHAA